MRLTLENRLARFEEHWALRQSMAGIQSECYEYAAPGLSPYLAGGGGMDGGQMRAWATDPYRSDFLFDATTAHSTEKLANTMVGQAFPPGEEWATMSRGPRFAAGSPSGGPDGGMQPPNRQEQMLQDGTKKLFAAIHASNFTKSVLRSIHDGLIAGTGLLKVGVDESTISKLRFEAPSHADVALEVDAWGEILGVWRKVWVTPEEAYQMWPEAERLPEEMQARGMPKRYVVVESTRYDVYDGIWRYHVDLRGQGQGSGRQEELFEDELLVSPWMPWRYAVLSGEIYGRSPVMMALPHARTINHAKRTRLRAASIRSVGAWTAKSGDVFNPATAEITEGAVLIVGSNDPTSPTLRALELPGDPSLNEIVIEDERAMIRMMLFDNALPPPTGAVRSATEIIERRREALQVLGGAFLRLTEDIGRPVLRAAAYFLARAGRLDEIKLNAPEDRNGNTIPLKLDGTDVAVTFKSPTEQAQQAAEASSIIQAIEAGNATLGPQVVQATIDGPKAMRELWGKFRCPAHLLREEETATDLEQQFQQAAAPPMEPMAAGGAMA